MKTCSRCKETKPLREFNKKRKSGVQPYCRPCQSDYQREMYAKNPIRSTQTIYDSRALRKAVLIDYFFEYLTEHPCVDCGTTDILVLEFDHVIDDKHFGVHKALTDCMALDRVKAEVAKCEIRCANCHRKVTAERKHNWRWHKKYGECTEGCDANL
jgi:hypothetical protein